MEGEPASPDNGIHQVLGVDIARNKARTVARENIETASVRL